MKLNINYPLEIVLTPDQEIEVTLKTIDKYFGIRPSMFISRGVLYETIDGIDKKIKNATSFDNCLLILAKELRFKHEK